MKISHIPLAATNVWAQVNHNPLLFASNVSMRFTGRPLHFDDAFWKSFREKPWDFQLESSAASAFNGRVLHVLTNSLPHSSGGYAFRSHKILQAQNFLGLHATAITRLGYPVSVGRFPTERIEYVDGVEYARSLPHLYPFSLEKQIQVQARQIAIRAAQLGASVLHTTTPWTNAAATSIAAKELNISWVYEVRGEPEATWASSQSSRTCAEKSSYYQSARQNEEAAMNAATAVMTLSEVSASALRQRGVDRPIVVTPNAVEDGWAEKRIPVVAARERLGLRPGRYVGAVSSIVSYEGFDDLIKALRFLPEDVQVLLVGDGTELSSLRRLAKREQLEGRVIFAGRQPHDAMALWYSALDVFVVPRKDVNLTRTVTPLKTLQAQAFQLPIVASDLPALREVTRGSGRYVPPGAPQKLADAIMEALGDDRERNFPVATWSEIAERQLGVYENL